MTRKPRRPRPPDAMEAPAPRPGAPQQLQQKLEAIASGASAPEEALEAALRAILDASGARAGALCLFDPRQGVLRLATEVGLSDDGCRQLRQVRRGDPRSWDMPLHGLLNRRAYLIESAPQNRYVPRLVEVSAVVRTVACVPIYGGLAPLGSLILVATAPRSFAERDIRVLERPLRRLGRMIETIRRLGSAEEPTAAAAPGPPPGVVQLVAERDGLRAEVAARTAERAVLDAELAAGREERSRLRAALEAAEKERSRLAAALERAGREAERGAALTASLAASERERARLATALEAAVQEGAERMRAGAALERARCEAEKAARTAAEDAEAFRERAAEEARETGAEIARLQARVAEVEAAAAEERELGRRREREQQRLVGELRAAAERDRRLREELRATTEDALSADKEQLREAIDAARAAEEARAAAAAEAEAARAAALGVRASLEGLGNQLNEARAESERHRAAERSALERIERVRAEALSARTRLEEMEREAATLREEREQLTGADRRREAEAKALAAERDRLRDALGAAEQERDRLAARVAANAPAGEVLARETAERTRLGQALADGAAERARLEAALGRETAERTRVTEALREAETALAGLDQACARHEAEAAARLAEIERLSAERDRLLAAGDPAGAAGGPASAPEPAESGSLHIVTVAMAGPRPRGRETRSGQPVVAVVDLESVWEDVAVEGHEVVVVPPGEEIAERFQGVAPARTIANLAAPGVVDALASLRAAGSTARFWGCLAGPGRDDALALGMVEPAGSPLDPDALVAALGAYAQRGTRVVTAGGDVDVLMSLRQALARRGMSVSMAWDAKQASDLLAVVQPELVVVDLALPRREGYRIVTALTALDPVPHAVVVVPAGEEVAGAFAAVLDEPSPARVAVRRHALLARLVARSEAPPAERNRKLRAIGRK